MWKDICYPGVISETENALGEKIETITYPSYVFCDKRSVTRSEFYQAATTDYKPEIILKLKIIDYAGQKYIKLNNDLYTVVRTYEASSEDIEITLERGIAHGNT
ncbi:MAG: hypothetical protein CVV01_05600 [Firmicutes bacterium HGW-Firmicutes-6]|jgi:hypothetical protein|nr:MAG: hypothetical protein CVV01_05600 [Firmicutes bacterium HGW-Firmicutes-6]